jgi:DNA-binding LacI/PurR family transcriptional regulator
MDRIEDTAAPLHARVAAKIRQDVRAGTYAPGQRIPAEVQLAQELGVSRGTVRMALRALHDEGVIQTIAGRGSFVPDAMSRRSAGLIGMILPSVVRARNPDLITGAEETVRQAGYSLVLGISGDDRWLETEQIQRIVGQGASGLIVYSIDGQLDDPALRQLVDRGFPVVLIDRYFPDLAVDVVTMDNISGGFLAVQHLVQRGYSRIGYIGTDNLDTSSIFERMAGYRWALEQLGLPLDPELICTSVRRLLAWPPREPDKERHNEQILRAFLSRPERPDAVFVCNDYVAFEVVQAAEDLQLRIPEDLAIVGFDNVAYTDYFGVPLTTVGQPRLEIGATAATLLLERIAGRRTRVGRIVVSSRLIVRRSTAEAHLPAPAAAERVLSAI